MSNTRSHPILHYLRQVLGASAGGGVGDAELLDRFVHQRDEAAFELLVWRHAGMVLHVCRHVLNQREAAEDAFQATFLVFLRKAPSIRRREALASWLYRVAYHIALKARAQVRKRATLPAEWEGIEAPQDNDDASLRELRRMICEEVDRLPAKYRAPIVACFFEGKTHEEAAKQLGWPRGTVAGRLARARVLLQRRLLRRGVTLTMSALLTALAIRPAQAALPGLIHSVVHTARLLAAGQAVNAVVAPHVGALAEGVLQAMYWSRIKIFTVVLFVVGLGGAGVTLLATPEEKQAAQPNRVMPIVAAHMLGAGPTSPESTPVNAEEQDEPAQGSLPEEKAPEDAARLARDMARSRLNLKKLALAMHNYHDAYGHFPLAATTGRNGKALLSWRVALLPFLEEQELYRQFKQDEPWNSAHNLKLLSRMPAVFAPPGVKTARPYSTFYQVFVSPESSGGGGGGGGMPGGGAAGPGVGMGPPGMGAPGMPGMAGGMRPPNRGGMPGQPGIGGPAGMGGPPAMGRPGAAMGAGGPPAGMAGAAAGGTSAAAFVKGETMSFLNFTDGTSNTILLVEAGNPVPWTKPEDLHYAEDEPLPELGGLFPNVFHAAFADGSIHTLTKNYNEKQLRYAITANDGNPLELSRIEAHSRPRTRNNAASVEAWQKKNQELRKELEMAQQQIRLFKEELNSSTQ